MRKVKIMVAAVATTLLVASPAFAADNNGGRVFTAETGFLQDTTLTGAGFDLTAGSITNNNGNELFDNGDNNGVDNDDGGFFNGAFEDGFFGD